MSKLTLLRVENGARDVTVDEALTLSHLLGVSLARLLSPPKGETVRLTDKLSVDGAWMRNQLMFGDPLLLTPTGRRAALRIQLVHAVEILAQAIVDARRGGDEAGVEAAFKALVSLVDAHRTQITDLGDTDDEEATQ